MAFFRTEPNLPDGDRARLEFHLQQVAECIGIDRMKLPVLGMQEMTELYQSGKSPEQLADVIGEHLNHDVSGISVVVVPEQPKKCGGGG